MANTADKTNKSIEKFNELLKLLNNCRDKLHALYNLFVSCILTAKSNNQEMKVLFEDLLIYRDNLTEITNSISQASKDSRDKVVRSAKSKIKDLSSKIHDCDTSFKDEYNRYNRALDECDSLRKKYKEEVVLCCSAYKTMNRDGVTESIEKGYKMQIKLIRKILDKINSLVLEYNKTKDLVDEKNKSFNEMFKLTNTLLIKLSE